MRSFEPRYLMLDGKTILHKGNYITLFATATASAYENGKQIDKNLRQYYRTVELVCLDLQYIIKVKLIMVDLRSISERKIQSIVHRLS